MAAPKIVTPSPDARSRRALKSAEASGLLKGPKSRHLNAKVTPALFDAAAKRVGDSTPTAVITAALATLAEPEGLGAWLAANQGILADIDPEIKEMIEW